MGKKCSRRKRESQTDSPPRDRFQQKTIEVGFVPGTRAAYVREFDHFETKLDRKTGATATVRDARRYLSRLKESGVSNTIYSHASAALQCMRGSWFPLLHGEDCYEGLPSHLLFCCQPER